MSNTKSEVLRAASVLAAAKIQAHSTLVAALVTRGEEIQGTPDDSEVLLEAVAAVLETLNTLERGKGGPSLYGWSLLS